MDDERFDGLARALGALADRRATARAALGGAVGVLGLAAGPGADAKKKKKKCKKPKVKCGKACCSAGQACIAGKCAIPCTFITAGSVMTLQANCTATETIEIPDGVTLDGNGKTITMAGPRGGFTDAGIRNQAGASSVEVRNLTIDGAAVPGSCGAGSGAGIYLNDTAAEISNVALTNLCSYGINAQTSTAGGTRREITLLDVDVSNIVIGDGAAIAFFFDVDASITGGTLRQISGSFDFSIASAIYVVGGARATIDDVTIEDAFIGMNFLSGQNTVENCTLTDVQFGIFANESATSLQATDNSIVGRGAVPGPHFGIVFGLDASGSATGNDISDFFDSAGTDGCGILVAADAGAVTIGANTFPDPPGNEQNVCDNRP